MKALGRTSTSRVATVLARETIPASNGAGVAARHKFQTKKVLQ
jgi:hypothetical protein